MYSEGEDVIARTSIRPILIVTVGSDDSDNVQAILFRYRPRLILPCKL